MTDRDKRLCVRVWAEDETEPEEGKQSHCERLGIPPKGWFKELPCYAAELYALERWGNVSSILSALVNVRDGGGAVHRFAVKLQPRTGVDVRVEKVR